MTNLTNLLSSIRLMGFVSGIRYSLGLAVEGRDYTEELQDRYDDIADDISNYSTDITLEQCLEASRFGITTIFNADTHLIMTGDYCDHCNKYYETSNVNLYQCCPDCANESQSSYGWM